MSLQAWLQNNTVVEHQATVAEVRTLLSVVDRELADAAVAGLSHEGRFTHAYDAGLLLCKLALHVSGFELQRKSKGHHSLWINSLVLTLGITQRPTLILLSQSSNLRHMILYEQTGVIQLQDADDLLATVRQLRTDILKWLNSEHPALDPI